MKPTFRTTAITLFAFTVHFMLFSAAFSQKNGGDLYPKDSIFFEHNTILYTIDATQPGNCWKAGHPSKTWFNQAYSAPLAILTDTSQYYPVNNESSFSFMITDTLSYPPCGGATYFEFLHKFDTDTILDYGFVEYTFDQGNTWSVAKDTVIPDGPYGFTMFIWAPDHPVESGNDYMHPIKTSGHSDGWIRSRFTWQWFFPVKETDSFSEFPDTIIVRFTFRSDANQTNKEGWMIDNIVTGCMDVGSGIFSPGSAFSAFIAPNPLTSTSVIRTAGTVIHPLFEVFDPLGRPVFRQETTSLESIILNRNDFAPGIYFWRLTDDSWKTCTGKLMVE